MGSDTHYSTSFSDSLEMKAGESLGKSCYDILYCHSSYLKKVLAQFIVYTGPMSKMEKVESSVCSVRGSIAPGKILNTCCNDILPY